MPVPSSDRTSTRSRRTARPADPTRSAAPAADSGHTADSGRSTTRTARSTRSGSTGSAARTRAQAGRATTRPQSGRATRGKPDGPRQPWLEPLTDRARALAATVRAADLVSLLRPAALFDSVRRGDRRQRGRLLAAAVAAAVLVVTGLGWHSVDTIVSSIDRISDLGLGGADDGSTDILMVGVDSRTDAHGNPLSDADRARLHAGDDVSTNTDTIILLRFPNDGRSATALSIPRDSYVDIPGIGMGKINSAYGTTKEGVREKLVEQGVSPEEADRRSTLAGRQALIKSVAQLTGVTVDHYAEIGMLGFALLTDAVGGVPVCLNAPVDEPMSGADFPAGPQRLNGAQALSFVRQRHQLPRGDLDRIVRQQVYMAALVHQMISAQMLANPARLQQLADALGRTVVLDDGWNVLSFARDLHDIAGGSVKFETIPVTDSSYMTDEGQSVVRVDPDAVRTYVAATTGKPADGLDPASVTADVYNYSGPAGLAGGVADVLTGHGFRTGTVDNWIGSPVPGSRILTAHADDPKALAVSKALGNLPVVADPTSPQGAIRVVLAGDYAGPGLPAAAPASPTDDQPAPVPAPPPMDAGQNGPKCVN